MNKLSLFFAFLFLANFSLAQTINLNETPSNNNPTFNINQLLKERTPSIIKLRIPNTPDGIRTAELYDERGRQINFRFLLDPKTGLILGTHLDGIVIELIHDASGGYVILGRDKNGRIVDLHPDDLSLTDINFGERCFTLESGNSSSLGVNIGIALDVSGSMDHVLRDVSQAFQTFIQAAPENAMCQVLLFDDKVYNFNTDGSHGYFQTRDLVQCKQYARNNLQLPKIGGGTNIAEPASLLFEGLLKTPNARNIVIILTDGNDALSGQSLFSLRDQAVEKAGVYTVLNFLGNYSANAPISRIGDETLIGLNGAKAGQAVFDQTTQLIQSQKVLHLAACPTK